MKINFQNPWLLFIGFCVILLIITKLFGYYTSSAILFFSLGCIIGSSWTANKYIEIGRTRGHEEIIDELGRESREKKHRKFMENQIITISGVTLDKENFPKLYAWAKKNPETLEQQLISIADAWHGGNKDMAAVSLESDMEHG